MNQTLITNVVEAARYVFKCRDELGFKAIDDLEAAVKALEKSLATPKHNPQPTPATTVTMPTQRVGKFFEYRARAEAYLRENGPSPVICIAKACGVPTGSITSVLREARFTRDKDGLMCLSGKPREINKSMTRGRPRRTTDDPTDGPSALARGRNVIAAALLAIDKPVPLRTLAREVSYSEKFLRECLEGDPRFKATGGRWVLK